MDKTFTNFIRTNAILKIKDQKFSNEVIFKEVLKDGDLININLLNLISRAKCIHFKESK